MACGAAPAQVVSGPKAKASPVSRLEDGSARWSMLGGVAAHRA
jgi:hypothetical protein